MNSTIKTRIVKIGNSQGIRIPKLLLEQTNLGEDVELEAHADRIVIRGATVPRAGWEEKFRKMAAHGDDQLLDDVVSTTTWDETEWEW